MGHAGVGCNLGVGWVMQERGGSCRGEVGHVGWGGSFRGRVGHAGVRWVIQGWGGPCRGGVGHAGVGWVM